MVTTSVCGEEMCNEVNQETYQLIFPLSTVCFVMVKVIYAQGVKDGTLARLLPDPVTILGGLAGGKETWPDHEATGRAPYLRQTEGHKQLLLNFTKEVVSSDVFRKYAKNTLLSVYMMAVLESFLVLAYHNNYQAWMYECTHGKHKANKVAAATANDAEGSESENETPPRTAPVKEKPARLFTNNMKDSGGQFKGWSKEGIALFNEVTRRLREQREDTVDPILESFELQMMQGFQLVVDNDDGRVVLSGGQTEALETPRKRPVAEDDLEDMLPKKKRVTPEPTVNRASLGRDGSGGGQD